MKEIISLVIPCYNEEESIPYFYKEIKKLENKLKAVEFEYIFVDDGSKDKTLTVLRELANKDKYVRYISFSRNFGKEGAMYAGLEASTGDYVTVIDADLEQSPSLIVDMYKGIKEEGYDIVGTFKKSRKKEPLITGFLAKVFYKIIAKISLVEQVQGAGDYRLMSRQVVDSILKLKEYNRYSKGIFSFVGFKTKWIELVVNERVAGETKWGFKKLLKYAFEGIIAFSVFPLSFIMIMALLLIFSSFIMFVFWIINSIRDGYFIFGMLGLSTLIVFLSGLITMSLGIIGSYLSKIYLEVKNRPVYIVAETEKNRKVR